MEFNNALTLRSNQDDTNFDGLSLYSMRMYHHVMFDQKLLLDRELGSSLTSGFLVDVTKKGGELALLVVQAAGSAERGVFIASGYKAVVSVERIAVGKPALEHGRRYKTRPALSCGSLQQHSCGYGQQQSHTHTCHLHSLIVKSLNANLIRAVTQTCEFELV